MTELRRHGMEFLVPLRGICFSAFLALGVSTRGSTGSEGRSSLVFYSQGPLTRASIALEHLKATEQMAGYRISLPLTVRS